MNVLRKKKALGLTEGITDLEQAAAVLEKEAFTNEEIAEVLEELKNVPTLNPGTGTKPPEPNAPSNVAGSPVNSPNAKLNLSGFSYKNQKGQFTGEDFKRYVELVGDRSYLEITDEGEKAVYGQLKLDDQYDFVLFKARPIRKARYVGIKDSPIDYVGIEIVNDQPIHTSRMSIRSVLEFNAQILNQHSIAGHGKYYVLKK